MSSGSSSDLENYVMRANVCKRLSREFNLPEMKCFDDISLHAPPEEHGLCNADVIIPSYYHLHKNPQKMQSFDYYEVIKDDIRNFRPLNKYQFEYIKTIPTEDKDELLHIFNDSLRFLGESLFSAENSVVRESRRPSDASVK
jgi:hypothetical protein